MKKYILKVAALGLKPGTEVSGPGVDVLLANGKVEIVEYKDESKKAKRK